MKLANSLLVFAVTAGIALLAVAGGRPEGSPTPADLMLADADPWFV